MFNLQISTSQNRHSTKPLARWFILDIKMLPFPVVGFYYLTCLPSGEHIKSLGIQAFVLYPIGNFVSASRRK
jgi:hypothetical protein